MSDPFKTPQLPLHECVRLGHTRLQPSWYTRTLAAQQNQTTNAKSNSNPASMNQQALAAAQDASSGTTVPVHEMVPMQADQTSSKATFRSIRRV